MTPLHGERSLGAGLDRWIYPYRAGAPHHRLGDLARQIVLVAMAFVAYFAVRGITKGAEEAAITNGLELLRLEKSLGIDWEQGAQQLILDQPVLVRLFNAIYVWGYWPLLLGALVYFWARDRREFTVLRDALFISGAVGLIVFAVYPVAPPRFLDGFTDTIAQSRRGMIVAQPPGFINKFAALPSFHVGWLALAGAMCATHCGARWRPLAWLPAIVMSGTVVFTANHYLIDIVVGVGFSLGALAVARRLHATESAVPATPFVAARAAPASREQTRDVA